MLKAEVQIIRSSRKTVSLEVNRRGEVILRVPKRFPKAAAEQFLTERAEWIDFHRQKMLARMKETEGVELLTEAERKALLQAAKEDLTARVRHFAPIVGVSYSRVSVKTQKTRWGSSSRKGNVNLNGLLLLAPESVRDYVVVHELCHQKEMNHSPRFWAEVERVLPGYRAERAWLKERGGALLARLP